MAKTRVALVAASTILFAAIIALPGIPTLRQDWHWPYSRAGMWDWLVTATSGWRVDGIGAPSAYPTEYIFGAGSAFMGAILGPRFGLFVELALIGALAAWGVRELCVATEASWVEEWGAVLLLLFNPWTYTEVVAGHLFMIVAAYGFLFLLASFRDGARSKWLLSVAVILLSAQLQFFILGIPFVLWRSLRLGQWRPVVLAALLFAPIAIGIVADIGFVTATPLLPAWELQQSVKFSDAMQLTGYFTHYDAGMFRLARFGIWALCICCILAIVRVRTKSVFLLTLCALGAGLFVTGAKGIVAVPFQWTVSHITAIGLFRELYDEVAIIVVCMVTVAIIAARRVRMARFLVAAAGAILLVSWCISSPWNYFVAGKLVAQAEPKIPVNSRYLLLPGFQPISLGKQGSGSDPNAISYAGNRTPLNEYVPRFPEDAAIARYTKTGDDSWLRALGVASVTARPAMLSKSDAKNPYTSSSTGGVRRSGTFNANAELATMSMPLTVSVASDVTRPAIQFADAGSSRAFKPFQPSRNLDITRSWVPAAFSFLSYPAAAQPWGGLATAGSSPHRVGSAPFLLAYVNGKLVGQTGRVLASGTSAFVWTRIPKSVRRVRCEGFCELIGTAESLPSVPLQGRLERESPVPFDRIAPWAIVAAVPVNARSFLLYRERYDRWWIAMQGKTLLKHFRVNGVFNGWQLGDGGGTIIVVELIAALQAIFEAIAIIGILALCCEKLFSRLQRRSK